MKRALLVAGAVVVVAELAHRRASRQVLAAAPGRSCAVLALGYRTRRDGRIHALQRWRTEIAVRTLTPAGDGCVIFSGGRAGGREEAEAVVMARYAMDALGLAPQRIRLETASLTTRENVDNSLALAEGFECIAIASDPLHAARARRYVAQVRPDLAERLVGADDYRVLERWWLKVPTALYEALLAVRDPSPVP